MTIDLKWGLPFVLPFVLLLMARGLFWVAGVRWDLVHAGHAAVFCGCFGVLFGAILMEKMHREGAKWNITIGGRE